MARRNHLDDFARGRRIGKLEEEHSVSSVAQEFGINKSVILRTWKALQTIGTVFRKVGGSHRRKATAVDARYIVLKAKRARNQSASAIVQQKKKLYPFIQINSAEECDKNKLDCLVEISDNSVQSTDFQANLIDEKVCICKEDEVSLNDAKNKVSFHSEDIISDKASAIKSVYPSLKDTEYSEKVNIVKSMYPDLKNIEHCGRIHSIISTQILVKTYTEEFQNKMVSEANKEYNEFQEDVKGIENYQMYDLIRVYQSDRKSSSDIRRRVKYLNSRIKRLKDDLWTSVKKEVSAKGKCEDGYSVIISHSYIIKELDNRKFEELSSMLQEVEEQIISDAFYSYSDLLMKLRIQQYLYKLIYGTQTSDYMKISQGNGVGPYTHCQNLLLKKCISILFNYQRQSIKDREFLEIIQQWLKILVSELLKGAKLCDYLFVVNHVIRCPNGIRKWASQFIQIPCMKSCSNGISGSAKCQCLNFTLLVLYLIINPAPDRSFFLRNVKLKNIEDSADGDFTVLDSEGEEEDMFEVTRDWSDEDVTSLLNQIPLARLYEHILLSSDDKSLAVKVPSEEMMLKLFAFSTALVNVLFGGLENFFSENFETSIKHVCNMIRHIVFYVSDYWSEGNLVKPELQAEYDRFIFHVIFNLFKFQKLGVWQFMSVLPFKCVSEKMLWNILWIFHSLEQREEEIYLAKDVDTKLQDDSAQHVLFKKLKSVSQQDQIYFLNLCKAVAFSNSGDENFLQFIIHEIYQVSFVEETLQNCLSKEGKVILLSLVKKYSYLFSTLLLELDKIDGDNVGNLTIDLVRGISLVNWRPESKDISILSSWLLSDDFSDRKSYIARITLTKMNWGFNSEGELVLPLELHQEIAVLVLKAYLKFDSSGNEWSVSNGLTQMLQFASINYYREEQGFVPWAWDCLFSLKLHIMDTKCPPWVQIYDGEVPDISDDHILQTLQTAYEQKHPAACYLIIVMTSKGHRVQSLVTEGLQCFSTLMEHQQYAGAIHCLYYIFPFFVKRSEELLSNQQFLKDVNNLIVADMGGTLSNITGSGAVIGAVIQAFSSMIKHQLYQASELIVECAGPLIKLWIKLLLKVLNIQMTGNVSYRFRDSANQVHFLLDIVARISLLNSHTRNTVFDLLQSLCNPLLTSNVSPQPSIWNKLFGSSNVECSLLNKLTLPEYPWLAWYVILAESKQKQSEELWNLIQEEMVKEPDMSPTTALKKSCAYLKISPPPLESLPIYRWGKQALEMPVSHPAAPLIWQQFFMYFFEKVQSSEFLCC
ncbi:ectopic P granules protein 5 homolog [Stegodyphus dumicola]|uniref:ectopic P granules protein 5 homolog n=1 Tax=Stegodyphus dumicola TaxID=202533 RepID=UPI0015A991DA|nr:ectopic P granules protein 5 homolog [Stegodyphus dumicola]